MFIDPITIQLWNGSSIEFGWPWALYLLLLPVLVRLLFPPTKPEKSSALAVPFPVMASHAPMNPKFVWHRVQWALAFMWFFGIIALSDPKMIVSKEITPVSARDLLVAMDTSGSMETNDFELENQPVMRMTAVKNVISDFIENRNTDRIGLIIFGSNAYLQSPLTFDHKSILYYLKNTPARALAGDKTAIGDAIGLAIKHFHSSESTARKVLILVTDGDNTSGKIKPVDAAIKAKEAGMVIYTIGIGRISGQVTRGIAKPKTRGTVDFRTLRKVASTTGGQFFYAQNIQELKRIYAKLDEIEPAEQIKQGILLKKPMYIYPLMLSLICSFLAFGIVYNNKQ